MSIEPFDWFNRFFGSRALGRRTLFEGFDEMRKEMQIEFEDSLKDIENKVPKDLIREYVTEDGVHIKEIGPLVYGSTTTIGPNGKPVVREFGNVRPRARAGSTPNILAERQPLSEISTNDEEIKVTIELPGVSKEQIKINSYDGKLEITTQNSKRKFHEVIDLPTEVDTDNAKSTFVNGLLEITFDKKSKVKPRKSITVD